MTIELRKTDNDSHVLRCIRENGSVEEAELETKSLLVHDFTHLAYEAEAGLKESFWGRVASGTGFADLRKDDWDYATEIAQTEMIVGPLQSVVQGKRSAEDFVKGVTEYLPLNNVDVPDYLNVDFVERVQKRYQNLIGEWNALPFGETMTVEW